MPKYLVSGVDKTSGKASTVELFHSDRASAQRIAELEHNMVIHSLRRIDMPMRISGIGWARFFLVLWLLADALAVIACLANTSRGGLIYILAVIPSVAIPLCLSAMLDGLERLVESADEMR